MRQGLNQCGFSRCPLDALSYLAQPKQILPAIQNFPQVKFILSHLANDNFTELREVMAKFQNIYTDISGQFVSKSRENTLSYRQLVLDEIKQFLKLKDGLDWVMFRTDFPIQSYADSIELVKSLRLPPQDEYKIFYQNAAFVLGIDENIR